MRVECDKGGTIGTPEDMRISLATYKLSNQTPLNLNAMGMGHSNRTDDV